MPTDTEHNDTSTSKHKNSKTARRPGRPRNEGQWVVDGTTPLNDSEQMKATDGGLNVKERIETIYALEGFDSIPTDDLNGRMRWYGLYTQRRQDLDGTYTSSAETEELQDKYFMMRVRSDGGALSQAQTKVLGQISHEFARNTADISDRQNIQYHWIRIEDVPEIWRRLATVGLGSEEACGDVPRVVLGSPLAGIAADEIIDPTPVIEEIQQRFIGDPDLANLPRKFKSAITGHPSLDVVHEINDLSLVGVIHPELGPGYDVWVGGGLSTNPRLAERLGVFVAEHQAADVWHGVVKIFRDYGFRRLRNKARLKFLMAQWGPEKFRDILQTEYLGYHLPDGPAPAPPAGANDHVGVGLQRDGKHYVGAAPVVGRVGGQTLIALADLMQTIGSDRLRLTPQQKLVLLDVPAQHLDTVLNTFEQLDLAVTPSPFRRATMACTGIEFCKLAFVNTKGRAAETIAEIEDRLDDVALDRPLSLHINGCPNSCARIQTADIGLKGLLITDDDGSRREGFQVHLGGGLANDTEPEPQLGRPVRGLKLAATDVPDYVERLVRTYREQKNTDETFSQWVARADDKELS